MRGAPGRTSARKRLLVLTSTFPRWKGDTTPPFVYELCRRLADTFEVNVLAPHSAGAARREELDGLRVHRYRYAPAGWQQLAYAGGILPRLKQKPWYTGLVPFFALGQLAALSALLRELRFDCIHAHWLIPQGVIACLAGALNRNLPPLITTAHGGDLYGVKGPLSGRLKRMVVDRSTAVTVVSRAMRAELAEMGVEAGKISVMPMGVDLQRRFVPAADRHNGKHILFVGRLVEKKGAVYLIDAMPRILARHPEAVLQVVGEGPEWRLLKQRTEKLGIADRVFFRGHEENASLPAIYRSSDVVVFPSVVADSGDREGFGLVLVEALGCGCAAVVTDLPAMRDIVTDGETALVVPQKNPLELAKKVNHLLEDVQLRDRLATSGRRYVLENFDWQKIAASYTDLIQRAIATGHESSFSLQRGL